MSHDSYGPTRRESLSHIWTTGSNTWRLNFSQNVRVYQNLRLTRESGTPVYSIVQNGHVVAHSDALMLSGTLLTDCHFVVSARGRERARRLGKRTVHAFVEGKIALCGAMGLVPYDGKALPVEVAYDHRDDLGFRSRDFVPPCDCIRGASAVCLNELGMSAAYLF